MRVIVTGGSGRAEHDVDRAVYRPVKSAATRVAALLSGELDMIEPVPLQNVERIDARPGFRVIRGGELRVIMLGMQLEAPALRWSNVEGANPLRDERVREALYRAIDMEAINAKIMRGAARPIGTLVAVDDVVARPQTADLKTTEIERDLPQGASYKHIFGKAAETMKLRSLPQPVLQKAGIGGEAVGLPQTATAAELMAWTGLASLVIAVLLLLMIRRSARRVVT